MSKKLSLRLIELLKLSEGEYEDIYDLCCDHGHLGLAINDSLQHKFNEVILVDQVKSIVSKLESKVTDIPGVRTILVDARNLDYSPKSNNLIIISGVGGLLAIDIIANILRQNLDSLEILVSAHNNTFALRQYLCETGFGLINEKLIVESGQFYEILKISKLSKIPITYIGSLMWNFDDKNHIDYIQKNIKFLENKLHFEPNSNNSSILKEYLGLMKRVSL